MRRAGGEVEPSLRDFSSKLPRFRPALRTGLRTGRRPKRFTHWRETHEAILFRTTSRWGCGCVFVIEPSGEETLSNCLSDDCQRTAGARPLETIQTQVKTK